jgi:hypothetical protein
MRHLKLDTKSMVEAKRNFKVIIYLFVIAASICLSIEAISFNEQTKEIFGLIAKCLLIALAGRVLLFFAKPESFKNKGQHPQ